MAAAIFSACSRSGEDAYTDGRPNIVYILADDLGYGELGCYGQEKIETPHIDGLAAEGMRFTQHYSGAPVCAPARCVLLTGTHGGHAHIRGNDEWRERGEVWDFKKAVADPALEGQRPIPDSVVTVAELLKSAGYATGAVGKWGLGAPFTEGTPNRQGFDLFFGYNCQRQAHTYYPVHLWKNGEKVYLDNELVVPGANLPEGADPNDPASYAPFRQKEYAPKLMHREALQFIEDHKDAPFFFYYASPIPHVPLQAPQRWVEYYQRKFGDEEPYTGKSYFPNHTPHATYAAMVSTLDEQVGSLVAKLKQEGIYQNTLIIFSSDNGPTYTGGADSEFFDSARPFSSDRGRGKGSVYEGGIRVPMIAVWAGTIRAGSTSDHVSAFYDVLPTLCDVARIDVPAETDGISFVPELLGASQPEHKFLYWEFPAYGGQQAVRMGAWKAVRRDILKGNMHIELYNLESDIRETLDVANNHPGVVKKVESVMQEAHQPAAIERFRMPQLGD